MSLQKGLESSLGVKPGIRWGGMGQLDVVVDGAVVFSAQEAGRLPTVEEIVELVKKP